MASMGRSIDRHYARYRKEQLSLASSSYNDKLNDVERSIEGHVRMILKAKNSLTSMAGTVCIRA